MGVMEWFQAALMVQMFWSFSVVAIVYSLDTINVLGNDTQLFIDNTGQTARDISQDIGSNFEDQKNSPLADIGSLVFFSGNIIVDLFVNFAVAVPAMFGLLLEGIFLLIPADAVLQNMIKDFSTIVIGIFYVLGVIKLLTDVRTGREIA